MVQLCVTVCVHMDSQMLFKPPVAFCRHPPLREAMLFLSAGTTGLIHEHIQGGAAFTIGFVLFLDDLEIAALMQGLGGAPQRDALRGSLQ